MPRAPKRRRPAAKAKPKLKRPNRRVLEPEHVVRVWIDARVHGRTRAAQLHDIPRRSLYRLLDRVESEPELNQLAHARLATLQENVEGATVHAHTALIGALILCAQRDGHTLPELVESVERIAKVLGIHRGAAEPSTGKGGGGPSVGLPGEILQTRPDVAPVPNDTKEKTDDD